MIVGERVPDMTHSTYRLGLLALVLGGFVFTAGGDLSPVGGAIMAAGCFVGVGGILFETSGPPDA